MEQVKPCDWKLGQKPEILTVAASFPGRGICKETAKKTPPKNKTVNQW